MLGVTDKTDQAGIAKAFRKASLIHHPDKGGTQEMQQRLIQARDALVVVCSNCFNIPDFMDPDVIAKCRRIEEEALNGHS